MWTLARFIFQTCTASADCSTDKKKTQASNSSDVVCILVKRVSCVLMFGIFVTARFEWLHGQYTAVVSSEHHCYLFETGNSLVPIYLEHKGSNNAYTTSTWKEAVLGLNLRLCICVRSIVREDFELVYTRCLFQGNDFKNSGSYSYKQL